MDEQPDPIDVDIDLRYTERFWHDWSARITYRGPHADAVHRSLTTLKALTYAPTGGIVAAPTTSLPEAPGGERNWDYRYCWLRDATLTLLAFDNFDCSQEAAAWRTWLTRAVAGDPADLQIMYGCFVGIGVGTAISQALGGLAVLALLMRAGRVASPTRLARPSPSAGPGCCALACRPRWTAFHGGRLPVVP